jgi:hypothetical protein
MTAGGQTFENIWAWLASNGLPLLAALCCAAAAVGFAIFVARRLRPRRLAARKFVGRPILVVWRSSQELRQSDEGFCRDISPGGIGLDWPHPLKVGTRVSLRMSEGRLAGTGVVKRCNRSGERYDIGVQFDRNTAACAAEERP